MPYNRHCFRKMKCLRTIIYKDLLTHRSRSRIDIRRHKMLSKILPIQQLKQGLNNLSNSRLVLHFDWSEEQYIPNQGTRSSLQEPQEKDCALKIIKYANFWPSERYGHGAAAGKNNFPAFCQLTFAWEIILFHTSNSYDSQAIVLFLVFLFLTLLGEWKGSHSQLYMMAYWRIFWM